MSLVSLVSIKPWKFACTVFLNIQIEGGKEGVLGDLNN